MVPDPYPVYARLRETEPVYWDPASSAWVLTRYVDVARALHDPRLASARAGAMQVQAGRPGLEPLFDFVGRMMPVTDPPQHTRLRGLVNKCFTPHAVEALEPFIQRLVDQLLDRAAGQGRMEVIRDFAFPLPAAVICRLLGAPVTDAARIKQLCDDLFLFIKGALAATTDEEYQTSLQAALDLKAYFRPLVAERRQSPGSDLLSALVRVEEQGDRLSDEDLYANASLMLQAGHESTVSLIGNGTLGLLRFPEQWQKLRDDPSLVPHAIEEFLRYEAPIHYIQRQAAEDMDMGGKHIERGHMVSLMLGAANRDPAQFPNPDRLDIERAPNKHLAFGAGHHFCLGAPLLRLEARIAFASLSRRFPKLRLSGAPPQYREDFNLRGLKALEVAF
jgi:cytochrome P450